MKVQLNLNTMVKKSGHCGKVGVRGVGLKSLDLVWTVLRKAEVELQIEHTLRFFGGLFFGLKSLDLVWTVLRKAEVELQIEHTLRFFGGLFFGLKSLDLVWTVLRKAEIELQFEHTVRFFFIFLKISIGFW